MSLELTSHPAADSPTERVGIELAAQRRQHLFREAGVSFVLEMAAGMDANASRQVKEFTETACDRLGITDPDLRLDQWIDALLRYHFGGELVATLKVGPEDAVPRGETAVLSAVSPTAWKRLSDRLSALNGLLTEEERNQITVQIVPKWSHDRPAIVSPLALHDSADTAESSPRPVGARTTADD